MEKTSKELIVGKVLPPQLTGKKLASRKSKVLDLEVPENENTRQTATSTIGGHGIQDVLNNNQANSFGTSEISPVKDTGSAVTEETGDTTPGSFSCAGEPENLAEATTNPSNNNRMQKLQANNVELAMKPCKKAKATKKQFLLDVQKESSKLNFSAIWPLQCRNPRGSQYTNSVKICS